MKALFPRWAILGFAVGIFFLAAGGALFWILKDMTYYPGGPSIMPRHIVLPILLGALGLLIFLTALVHWIVIDLWPWLSLIYTQGWKIGNLTYKRQHCEHEWERDPDRPENLAKRYCPKCGSHQSLFSQRANTEEPSLNWRDQNFDEVRFL